MKQLHAFAIIFILLLLACSNSGNENSKASNSSGNEFVKKRFPLKDLPFKIKEEEIGPAMELTQSEIEQFFPDIASSDDPFVVYAIGRFQLFEGFTTLLFSEELSTLDFFLKSYPEGEFSLASPLILPHIGTREEGPETIATILKDGTLFIEDSDDGQNFTESAQYRITKDNQLK